jgi:hypothetical protein
VTATPPNADKTNGTTVAAAPASDANVPPLFYGRPLPLSQQYHATFKVRPENDFGFASKANAVPLTVPEFVMAARHYPIIFTGEDLVPTAAVGLASGDNLFVDVKGQWEVGQYIPAYVRRYPFILLGSETDEKLQVGIDDDARSNKPDARTLFKDGKETDVVKEGVNLCEQFHGAFRFGMEFLTSLRESGITEQRSLDVELPNGQKMAVGSFGAVNEEKFRDLPDATFLEWRKKGWLHAIYFHLQSMNNWEALLMRVNNRMAAAQAVR